MKTTRSSALLAATMIGGVALCALAGDLNPPAGPVTGTMKPLTDVEPRTAVNAANTPGTPNASFVISQVGSYYLTGNVFGAAGRHGIQIDADNVTLDLNGFALIGVPGSRDGITMPAGRRNVVIRNGSVRNWSENGIGGRINVGRIEHISATDNGGWGIVNLFAVNTMTIESCQASGNGGGIANTGGIRVSEAAVISRCVAQANTGDGISGGTSVQVIDCAASVNTDDGIVVTTACTVRDCISNTNSGDGIQASFDCLLARNLCDGNGAGAGDGAGIHVNGGPSSSRIEDNLCTDADRGIDVDGAGSFIARNTCAGNTTNWDVAAGNVISVYLAATAPAVVGDGGGNAPGSVDPSANYTF